MNFGLTPDILKNGIIIRSPNWLGDAVMALPAMSCLKQMLPFEAPFYVVSPDNLSELFESIPYVNKIIKIGSGHSAWNIDKIREINELKAGFGFLFVNSFRSAWYFKKCIPKVFGASNGLRNFLLTKAFPVKWNEQKSYSNEHQSYKYLSMTYQLGASKWNERYPAFNLIKSSEIKVKEYFDFISNGKIMVIAPGASYGPAKRWYEENYNLICAYWVEEKKGKVIIAGSKNELDSANKVVRNIDNSQVLNLAGKTNLKELMYILKKSDLCICNDSGIMHLASALDIKGVSIFGSTDPNATGPLSKKWKVLVNKQDCSPCFARKCINIKKDYRCLNSITPETVIQVIKEMDL